MAEAVAPPPAVGRRRNPRRGCAAVAEAPPLEEAGGAARGRRRTRRTAAAGGGDDAGDGERADSKGEESVKNKSTKINTAAGRGRGAARKAATDSGSLPSVSEESGDLEAVEDGDRKILKGVKPEVHDSPQIPSVKRPERGGRREQGAPARATTPAVASAKEQAGVGDARVAPFGVEVEEEEEEEAIAAGANPAVGKSCVDMESMTLEEWFDRMEKYLPKVINGIADEVISEIKAKAERFNEYVGNSLDPAQRDRGGG